MNHTVSGTGWRDLQLQRPEVGEAGIDAALCGAWGCPVLLVTGDEAVCREGSSCSGRADDGRRSRRSLGRYSARHRTPAVRAPA